MSLSREILTQLAAETAARLRDSRHARDVGRAVGAKYPHATDGDQCQAADEAAERLARAVENEAHKQ